MEGLPKNFKSVQKRRKYRRFESDNCSLIMNGSRHTLLDPLWCENYSFKLSVSI